MRLISFISFLFFSTFLIGQSQSVYLNDDKSEHLIPIGSLSILVDSTNRLELENVIEDNQDDFKIYPNFKPKDYCLECSYLIRLPIIIEKGSNKQWILEFYDQTIDSITAYLPDALGGYSAEYVGDYLPFSDKSFSHKNFEWLINSKVVGNQALYFRVKSHSYADIRIAIRTVNRFVYYSLNEYFLYGIFYGMIFIVSIYNFLIFFAIRERKYLYYSFYITSVFVYSMCVDGTAYQYLWPNQPQWNQIAYGTALFSIIFWALLFSKRFLNTRVRSPLLDKALLIVLILRSVVFLYSLLFDHSFFEYRNIEIIPLTLIFYTSIAVWLKGHKSARFFVLAYGMLFIGFLVKALITVSIIPFSIITYYSLHVSFLLEMLFLTFALSDRVRILKANRDKALKRSIAQHIENAELKDKVNRELETKITERTQQLESKNIELAGINQKLFSQTEAINQINSKLDLDNWKLKNNIKEALRDRLINKNLQLDQFNDIFPDQLTCFRFLEKLKWGNGYRCTKCNNEKYSDGKIKFSRRCTKCGYLESITSNTIFHRVKFPLQKAFYILYVTNNPQNNYTLDDLSEMLDLRRNTVWNFRKKIEEVYENKKGNASSILINDLFSSHLG